MSGRGRTCDDCGGAFTVPPTHPQQRFCSRSCSSRGKRRLPWLVCARVACGVRFPQRKTGQRFCSVECGRFGPRPPRATGATLQLLTHMSGTPWRE